MKIASLLLIALAASIAAVAYINHQSVPLRTTVDHLGFALLSLGIGSSLWNWGHTHGPLQAPHSPAVGQVVRKHEGHQRDHQNRAA